MNLIRRMIKTGLGLNRKYRKILAYINFFKFWFRKSFLSFEHANLFLPKIDKLSLELILKKYGARIGKNCDIETGLTFHNCRDYSNLVVGNSCHIGKNCFFDLKDKVDIGENVVISMQTTFITHQDLNKSDLRHDFPSSKNKIIIKNNCYIGANVTILKGIIINEFSMVAAGAVVNKDVPEYSVVGGVPAKIINKIDKR